MGQPSSLECSRCGTHFPAGELHNLCQCGGPLLVRYDLASLRNEWRPEDLKGKGMWRYHRVLPLAAAEAVTLGEGGTPITEVTRLGPNLWIKDEGLNPTGSFKARGLSCAVSMALKLGVKKLAIPSAGNAAGALSAYAAKAGLPAHVFMPRDVPQSNYLECKAYGADVTLVNGLIGDCARLVAEGKQWFDVSTLKEPYRIEGKKTMGYEIAEHFGWTLPEAIIYPCGGGVGLIGIWKAFDEMGQLGWIGPRRPKMIAVQAAGCAPIVQAFDKGLPESAPWPNAHTVASGLRVPKALGDRLVLEAVRASGGTAVAVSDEEMLDGALRIAREEGIFAAPEGGACLAAVNQLRQTGFLAGDERVLMLNTGSGLKYQEAFSTRFPRNAGGEQDKLGGLITPR